MFGILSRLKSRRETADDIRDIPDDIHEAPNDVHETVGVMSREDVVAAYRWLMGREPESEVISGYDRIAPDAVCSAAATSSREPMAA